MTMKILVLIPNDEFEKHSLETIKNGVKRQVPLFEWTVTSCTETFTAALGSFKINANESRRDIEGYSLCWPNPVNIMKNSEDKAKVWEDIQSKVIKKFQEKVESDLKLEITEADFQRLLKSLISSSAPFSIELKDNTKVNINCKRTDGVNMTSSDIASMLAASWIFGSKQIRIPKDVTHVQSELNN
jgi:hypothetical protein